MGPAPQYGGCSRTEPAPAGSLVGIDSTLKVIAADADLGPVPPHSGRGRPPTRPANVRAGATSPSVEEWAVVVFSVR